MHYNATLRVRELTQNIYDIGDEIAEFINHVAQAMADWDRELVEDCLLELADVIQEGRAEVRPGLVELNGLRQAFISGIRAGQMSNTAPKGGTRSSTADSYSHPGRTLAFMHQSSQQRMAAAVAENYSTSGNQNRSATESIESYATAGAEDDPTNQAMASTASWRIWMREHNEALIDKLSELEEWVVAQTRAALESQSVLLQQSFSQAERTTKAVVEQWVQILDRQPTLAAAMRGEAPPEFLDERARVDAIISKLARAKRAREASDAAV